VHDPAFVRRFQSRVYGMALSVVNDPVLAEDVAYLGALERDGADARLPDGRRSPAQRKIHAENVGRVHGGA